MMLASVSPIAWAAGPLAVFVVIYVWNAFARTPKGRR